MENFILSFSDKRSVAKLGSGVSPSDSGCPRDPLPVWAAPANRPALELSVKAVSYAHRVFLLTSKTLDRNMSVTTEPTFSDC